MINKLISLFHRTHRTFEGQDDDEQVVLLLRKHIFVIIVQIVTYIVAAGIPFGISRVAGHYIMNYGLREIFIFCSSVWFLLLWLAVFYSLTLYVLSTIIVTNKRIVESKQLGLFNRRVSELHLSRVQDVSTHTRGFIETLLTFGTISIQTAGAEQEFNFSQIPHPERVKDKIMDMIDLGDSSAVHN